jgi:hypothetical protein
VLYGIAAEIPDRVTGLIADCDISGSAMRGLSVRALHL